MIYLSVDCFFSLKWIFLVLGMILYSEPFGCYIILLNLLFGRYSGRLNLIFIFFSQ